MDMEDKTLIMTTKMITTKIQVQRTS